jgi:hypothetical protein
VPTGRLMRGVLTSASPSLDHGGLVLIRVGGFAVEGRDHHAEQGMDRPQPLLADAGPEIERNAVAPCTKV